MRSTEALPPPDAPLEDFRALHRKLGIGRAVIVNASVHGTDNRVALDAIAVSNGTFRAVANIGDGITERALRDFAASRLAHFKVPQQVLIVEQIPKGPSGKLQRIGLHEKLAQKLGQNQGRNQGTAG